MQHWNHIGIGTFGLLALGVSGAAAGVTAVGEFAGDAYETFEGIAAPGTYPGPLSILNGAATVQDILTGMVPITFVWNGPSGEVLPYNGNLFAGTIAGTTRFEFAEGVSSFGGYFNTVSFAQGGSAVFYDMQGAEIESMSFDLTPTNWTWLGWSSDVAIGRIELTGAAGDGFGFQFDDLTYTAVPSPAGLSVGLLALAGAAGRRRR